MAEPVDYSEGIGRKELLRVRRRFLNIHKQRLQRIEQELTPGQSQFIQLLPLLLHINHPLLPGFSGSDTPAGIPDYTPGQALIRSARKLSRSFAFQKRARRRYRIQGLYLMGSMGSIAQTASSDFDIWLCYDPELGPRGISKLQAKATRLEEWAAEVGLEAHFFLIDVEAFRHGNRDQLSKESSGSTQPRLLLEEFYRTGIWLAGRFPLWWLIPPEEENNYTRYVEMLIKHRFVDPIDCLDFGGLEQVPAEEFFGAALWQLYKGIESPYKAILKLLLTEAYAQNYPKISWLCQEMKTAIYQGHGRMEDLDPYLMMYNRVEHYLKSRGEEKRLELARKCLYFKTEQIISRRPANRHRSWQWELMHSLSQDWGWDQAHLLSLDSRANWKIDRVLEERNTLVRELSHSYRLLTDFGRTFAGKDGIDPLELSLLGRKLYTALERRPGKIDRINPGISHNLGEEKVSLHYTRDQNKQSGWHLFLGNVTPPEAQVSKPIKSSQGLIEILTWCHLNRVVDRHTIITLYPKDGPVTVSELQALTSTLGQLYPNAQVPKVPMAQLSAQPFALSCSLFLNTGKDPLAHLSKMGRQLTSDRNDPLSFGSAHTSLVESAEQLIETSWGETLVQRYQGTQGILESLCNYLHLGIMVHPDATPPEVHANSFSSIRGASIAKRLKELFNDVAHTFSNQGEGLEARYLLLIENDYYLIQHQQESFGFITLSTYEELMDTLAEPQSEYRPLVLDSRTLTQTPLPTLFRLNRAGVIQLFHSSSQGHTELYILDENGALFHQQLQGGDEHYLLVQQQRFLSGLQLMRSIQIDMPAHRLILDSPEFHRLHQNHEGDFFAEPRTPPRHPLPDSYQELQLIIDGTDLTHSPHLFNLGEHEFSSLEYGAGIYSAVAEEILSFRQSRQGYPIYLTGLDIANATLDRQWSTIELYQMKKRVEQRLNHALKQLLER
ncbi:MAG: class I adenylate cyclase [Gammaproteobacteria bacterium]|nr:class I adenylate cyclase [Gammaproteobacteria bacterium]